MIKAVFRPLWWGVLSTLLSMGAVQAQTAAERLNAFVSEVNVFQARFEQTVLDASGQVLEEAQGQFMLSRPGRFRWNYENPYPQQIVADGERIWFYDEDLEQITVQSQDEALSDTPAGLLSGKTLPEVEYVLTNLPSQDGLQWVELNPREPDANYQNIRLAFDGEGLAEMLMVDAFDQHTHLRFTEVVLNPTLDSELFVFTPPEGVDVVGE